MSWLEIRLVFLCSPGENVEKGRGEKEGERREREISVCNSIRTKQTCLKLPSAAAAATVES